MLVHFKELVEQVKFEETKKVVVALAEDKEVLQALEKAREAGLAEGILVGNPQHIAQILTELKIDEKHYEVKEALNETEAVQKAVKLVHDRAGQVLMKGLCSTSAFLKGILNRETGLRSGKVLSHLAIFESPFYHKLFMMSDAAMNINPNLQTKIAITENAIQVAHNIGIENPKVAIISAVEKVNPDRIPSSADAAIIAKMGDRQQIEGAVIDGPLAVDNALSKESCDVKGLQSPVGGDADICIVPNIETGNSFYKLLTVLGKTKVAGIILGACAPVVLTSRADSEESKFLSIITALKVG
jgi:phosphate butyryltransferase